MASDGRQRTAQTAKKARSSAKELATNGSRDYAEGLRVVQQELQAMRSVVAEQAERIAELHAQLEAAKKREHEVWGILFDLHDYLADLEQKTHQALESGGNGRARDDASHGNRERKRLPYEVYRQIVSRTREIIEQTLPRDCTVVVISRGDDQFLQLGRRQAWHFPRREDGVYAGYYPASDGDAVQHLEELRGQGADYLVIPSTALWWLEHYDAFRMYLEQQCRIVVRQEDTCLIYALRSAQ